MRQKTKDRMIDFILQTTSIALGILISLSIMTWYLTDYVIKR